MTHESLKFFDAAEIRRATLKDVAEILAVQKSAPEAAQWSREIYAGLLAPQETAGTGLQRKIFCVVMSQRVLGFAVLAILGLRDSTQYELENMAVDPSWRRRGVGGRLVDAVLDCCRGDVGRMTLEVRKSNFAAIELYKSKGFIETGLRKQYYAHPVEDAIQMEWKVEAT